MIQLDNKQEFRTLILARNGGYSVKFICKQVFDLPNLDAVTVDQASAVSRLLHRSKVRLKDWRNGLSPLAMSYAKAVLAANKTTAKAKSAS